MKRKAKRRRRIVSNEVSSSDEFTKAAVTPIVKRSDAAVKKRNQYRKMYKKGVKSPRGVMGTGTTAVTPFKNLDSDVDSIGVQSMEIDLTPVPELKLATFEKMLTTHGDKLG